ncbi:MAG: hypothetical protein RDV48_09600 [Candidatus Eremiobacteraeota bacterium]|nr:hypothetical protein [Candidatus Eremiobacteraeota bacterium]
MDRRDTFTKEEWELISHAPMKVAFMASAADRGFIADSRELSAFPTIFADAMETYKDNELISFIFDDLNHHREHADLRARAEEAKKQNYSLTQTLMEDIVKVFEILQKKASKPEMVAFKKMLYNIAFEIVNASGEGFMGTGNKISDREAAYLEKLRSALGLP